MVNATRGGTTWAKSSQDSLRSPGQPRSGVKVSTSAARRAHQGRSGTGELEGPAAGGALGFSLRSAVRGPPPRRTQPPPASAAALPPPSPRVVPGERRPPPPGPPRGQGLVWRDPQRLARFGNLPWPATLTEPWLLLHHPCRSRVRSLPTPPTPPLLRAHGRAPEHFPDPSPSPPCPPGS